LSCWLRKGHSYLIDAYQGTDGHYYPASGGASNEVTSPRAVQVLDYLRQRSAGKTKTSLTVDVTDRSKPVAGAEVTITSLEGVFSRKTGTEGRATFDEIASAMYGITATQAQYHLDTESSQDKEVEVLAGTCAGARVVLRAETEVSGLVRDSKGAPAASLELDLLEIPEDLSKGMPFDQPSFHAKTNAMGEFHFESVTPGRYYLGTNLMEYVRTSSVPRTYYPGQPSPDGAIPIE
jgi:hypothetical protein